jgi:aryl-alcohol dehydrogenase-like predicted oxidoreductase
MTWPLMKYARVNNISKEMSRVVMGSMAFQDAAMADPVYDKFLELSGNCFDTARIYGAAEEVLGRWVQRRGVREEIVFITKGAHTPSCYPKTITTELVESLDRLQT